MRGHEYADIRAFVAVAEHGSFSRAAAFLQIAPSTLSTTIRNLEDRMGLALLNRTTRSVSVTGAGSRLLARFKPAMEEMEAAVSDARDLRARPAGTVRLHMPRPAYSTVLEPVLGKFHRTYRDILLEVVVDDAVVDLVAAGFDLGVQSRAVAGPSMSAVAISGELRHVAVASPAYVAEHGSPNAPQDLTRHQCINWRQPGTASPYHWQFWIGDRWASIAVTGPLIVSHCDIAVKAALDAVGVAFVSEAYASADIAAGRLVPLLQGFLPPHPGWYLCYLKGRRLPAATLALVDFLRNPQHRSEPIGDSAT